MKKTAGRSPARMVMASVVSLLLISGCAAAAPEAVSETTPADDGNALEVTSIRVATSVSNSFPFVVVQAAERLGTFEGSGLDVELIEGTTPTIGQIMAGGQADVALAGANSLAAAIHSGVDMTMVAACLAYWDQRIIARPDVESVEDLKGGNFGITGAGSPGEYSVVKMADSLGWDESDYTVTSLGNLQALIAALTAGSIDAFAWSSDAAFRIEASGDGKILAPAADYVGTSMLQAFSVVSDFATENPNTVRAFFEAYFATVEKIQADPQLFIDVLVEEWEVDPAVAERVAEESLPRLSADGSISDDEMAGILESAAFTLDIPVSDLEDIPFVSWKDLQ